MCGIIILCEIFSFFVHKHIVRTRTRILGSTNACFSVFSSRGEQGRALRSKNFPSTNTTTELQQSSKVNVLEFPHFSSPWLTSGEDYSLSLIRLKIYIFVSFISFLTSTRTVEERLQRSSINLLYNIDYRTAESSMKNHLISASAFNILKILVSS